jgi:hypothetical protein
MSIEIDRLLAFRKENKYVNSAKEFQNVTKVSDSLLNDGPYFKFQIGKTKKIRQDSIKVFKLAFAKRKILFH